MSLFFFVLWLSLCVYDVSAMVLSCDVFIEIVIILILHVFDCMCFIIFSH